ncbi:MAG: magnesium protoporphyrin IX methyltransferase [Pseudomonadota bacterium]
MRGDYADTRSRLETYFDRTAHGKWTALTSDAPVSRIRQTVREGRDAMRAALLAMLPADLRGAEVLDAGCGVGQLSVALAERGASVTAVDISPRLIDVARERAAREASLEAAGRIRFIAGDMLEAAPQAADDPSRGAARRFDYAVAMDSLLHYRPEHVAAALDRLSGRVSRTIHFTMAPRTPLLTAMHWAGKAFPQGDRSPAIAPISPRALTLALNALPEAALRRLVVGTRVARGFYISQAYSLTAPASPRGEAGLVGGDGRAAGRPGADADLSGAESGVFRESAP